MTVSQGRQVGRHVFGKSPAGQKPVVLRTMQDCRIAAAFDAERRLTQERNDVYRPLGSHKKAAEWALHNWDFGRHADYGHLRPARPGFPGPKKVYKDQFVANYMDGFEAAQKEVTSEPESESDAPA